MRYYGWVLLLLMLFPTAAMAQEEQLKSGTSGQEEVGTEWDSFEDPFAEETEIEIADPIEPFNRASFWINDKLYFYLLKPVARAYRGVPEPARKSVNNFFSNLGFPVRFVNSTLQLDFRSAGNELRRFLLNSSVGVAGLFDPAAQNGWTVADDEDLGQTLGSYGIGNGFYLVLPVFGPSTLRDGVGRVGDYFLDPLPYVLDGYELMGTKVYDRVNTLSLDNDTYEKILDQALDPYLFVRNAYIQRRNALIEK